MERDIMYYVYYVLTFATSKRRIELLLGFFWQVFNLSVSKTNNKLDVRPERLRNKYMWKNILKQCVMVYYFM